ncbi:MAG: hypothetical protein MZU97_09965 [Bacillus subtilis]|nr:hypothetical protein [Bacillus subtilis]
MVPTSPTCITDYILENGWNANLKPITATGDGVSLGRHDRSRRFRQRLGFVRNPTSTFSPRSSAKVAE